MDVLVLIDKLDDVVHNARPVPLTDQVRVDREEIYDILDQMRATIPEEIKQARWIVKERQEMLAEAKREADRILGEAREQAVREAAHAGAENARLELELEHEAGARLRERERGLGPLGDGHVALAAELERLESDLVHVPELLAGPQSDVADVEDRHAANVAKLGHPAERAR